LHEHSLVVHIVTECKYTPHLFLPCDAMHKRGLCRQAVSVCLYDTFVNSVKTSYLILRLFSPSGSQTILVFAYQTLWRYSNGDPLNGSVACRWGRQKSRFWTNSWLSIVDCCSAQSTVDVCRAVVYNSYGARLFIAWVATHQ